MDCGASNKQGRRKETNVLSICARFYGIRIPRGRNKDTGRGTGRIRSLVHRQLWIMMMDSSRWIRNRSDRPLVLLLLDGG